jgi:Methyltransferase domain
MSLPPSLVPIYRAAPEAEVVRGAQDYRETLRFIHERFAPDVYLEIGVRHGLSLALSNARVVVGVDPIPELRTELGDHVRIVSATSDEFFANESAKILHELVDLAFIDGMHHFEFALRDFMNVERHATAASIVIFDDVFPNHPLQAQRERQSGVWTGDVWKIVPCLRQYRPDLGLLLLDTSPTGLLIVTNLNPTSSALGENYEAIVDEWSIERIPPPETLSRADAVSPQNTDLLKLLETQRHKRSMLDR